jgi:hypothetical protein
VALNQNLGNFATKQGILTYNLPLGAGIFRGQNLKMYEISYNDGRIYVYVKKSRMRF